MQVASSKYYRQKSRGLSHVLTPALNNKLSQVLVVNNYEENNSDRKEKIMPV